jgi:hypothetical protein
MLAAAALRHQSAGALRRHQRFAVAHDRSISPPLHRKFASTSTGPALR